MKHIITWTIITLFPMIVFAHGAGEAIQQESNGYILSLESASAFVVEGQAERLNIEIETRDGKEFLDFTGVWVRIIDPSGAFLFAGTIDKAPTGLLTGISYLFPRSGAYNVTLRFLNNEKVIGEAEFTLPVRGRPSPLQADDIPLNDSRFPPPFLLVFIVLGIIVGLLLGIGIGKRHYCTK